MSIFDDRNRIDEKGEARRKKAKPEKPDSDRQDFNEKPTKKSDIEKMIEKVVDKKLEDAWKGFQITPGTNCSVTGSGKKWTINVKNNSQSYTVTCTGGVINITPNA